MHDPQVYSTLMDLDKVKSHPPPPSRPPVTSSSQGYSLAQQRRRQEKEEFERLSRELPIARAISGQHIDKTAVVRLALASIRLHRCLPPHEPSPDYYLETYWCPSLIDIIDGFLFVLSENTDILYVSETISIHLGLSQVEMTGNNIYEYLHPEDCGAMQEVGLLFKHECEVQMTRNLRGYHQLICNLRLKSSLTKRANKDTIRTSAGFKVVRVDAQLLSSGGISLHCVPLPTLTLSTVTVPLFSFVITTLQDLTIATEDLLRAAHWQVPSICGLSFYNFVHVDDTNTARKMHYDVHKMGSCKTTFFRLLINQTNQVLYVEVTAFRYTQQSNRANIDQFTLIFNVL